MSTPTFLTSSAAAPLLGVTPSRIKWAIKTRRIEADAMLAINGGKISPLFLPSRLDVLAKALETGAPTAPSHQTK